MKHSIAGHCAAQTGSFSCLFDCSRSRGRPLRLDPQRVGSPCSVCLHELQVLRWSNLPSIRCARGGWRPVDTSLATQCACATPAPCPPPPPPPPSQPPTQDYRLPQDVVTGEAVVQWHAREAHPEKTTLLFISIMAHLDIRRT